MEETIEHNLNNGGGKEITIRRSRCTLLEPEVLEDCNVVDKQSYMLLAYVHTLIFENTYYLRMV